MWKYFCYAIGIILGALTLFGGAFVLYSMPSLFADRINSNLPIVAGSEAYARYTNSSVPMQIKLYMFNVTNPEDVLNKNAKPKLEQVGPFALSERRRRNVVAISPDQKTLDYKLIRTYYFNRSESVPLDSIVTMPNAPAFSAFFGAEEKAREEESAANPISVVTDYVGNQSLYLTHKAEDWLFNGIKIDWLDSLNEDGVILDDQPIDNRFGFYYKKNDTWDERADGVMTVSTGADKNMTNIGRVLQWNKKTEVSFWRGKACNTIRGTDGQFFHPFVQKEEKLEIFAPDLCRTLSIEFIKTTSIRSIELYRFGISSSFFKPIDYDDETKCYCVKRSHDAKKEFCKLSGVVDVSTCRKKPIVLSTPHFYNGDPALLQAVEGLAPSAASHDTFIDIEPMTGMVLRVRRRLQVNVEMVSHKGFEASLGLKNRRLIHPFIWLEQSVVVPDELAQKLENKLTKKVRLVKILGFAAILVGPIILISTLIFIFRDIKSEDKKIRGAKSNSKKDTGGDYQKVQVILKPINSSNTGGTTVPSEKNDKVPGQ